MESSVAAPAATAGAMRGRVLCSDVGVMRLLGPDGGEQRSCPGDGQCNLTDLSTEAAMTEDRLGDYEVGSPTRLALNVLAHKWTLLIVLVLKAGPLRFTRLRALVPGVTSQVLRDSLRELERDGIVSRQEFVAVPPHVEYSLTALGQSLCEPARAIRAWAEKNGSAVIAARQRFDGGAGGPRRR
jgi:DNA-binding HxlR family transcriptional regulator